MGLSGHLGMKLFLLGANGRTGTEVIDLARARGHEVTAFVRSPQKLRPLPLLRIVSGNPLQPETLAPAMRDHDAVLSAIGPHPRDALLQSTLLADCTRATVKAMATSGVARLAIVSAALLFPEAGLSFAVVGWILRHHTDDLRVMEKIVQSSGLEWTIARPPRLTQASDTTFRAVHDALPRGSRVMSYKSLAAFMLEAVERRSHIGEIVGLGRGLEAA